MIAREMTERTPSSDTSVATMKPVAAPVASAWILPSSPSTRDDARLLIERDPQLETPRGQAIRTLLYLFERDVAIRLLRAG